MSALSVAILMQIALVPTPRTVEMDLFDRPPVVVTELPSETLVRIGTDKVRQRESRKEVRSVKD